MQKNILKKYAARDSNRAKTNQFCLADLIKSVQDCKEKCYPYSKMQGNGDLQSEYLLKALLLVGSTIDSKNPYGFIAQYVAFQKLGTLPDGVDGRKLAYDLGPGRDWLRLHKEVGKNWVLTEKGKEVFEKHHASTLLKPLVDQDRQYLLKGCNQKILFISEAPSPDAWHKQVLVGSENDFLMKSLLPKLGISLEEFKKYFFWVHYSNCFPGLKESGGVPNPPKNNVCFKKHTKHFIHCKNWDAIVLMGRFAYNTTEASQKFLDFLESNDCTPKRLINGVDAPVIVLPHCSGRNAKARMHLGDKFEELWKYASGFVKNLISDEGCEAIERAVAERLREHLVADARPKEKPILIIGDSRISRNVIIGIAKEFGYSSDLIKILDDYQKNKRLDVNSLQYSDKYSCILVGPNSHKMVNLGSFESLLSRLQKDEGFPSSLQLRESNGELKITKESLKIALEKLNRASKN